MSPRLPALAIAILAGATASACANEYHPEYHPVSTYSYVQNVTYARDIVNVQRAPRPSPGASVERDVRAALAGSGADDAPCADGGALACYRECFHGRASRACYRLGVMFDRGIEVVASPKTAARLYAMACRMGDCDEPPDAPAGAPVTSPGTLVVYGNVNGNVVIGR